MKYIIVLFFLTFFNICKSQDIFPMENSLRRYRFINESEPECNFLMNYYFNGDSVINNLQYKKLQRKIESNCYSEKNDFSGLLRNDDEKVMIVPEDSINEMILYDFSLKIGDTIKGYLQYYADLNDGYTRCYTTVSNIVDTILNDGIVKKKWELTTRLIETDEITSYGFYFIEGIGSINSLLSILALSSEPIGVYLATLDCFIIEGVVVYSLSDYCQEIIDAVVNYSYKPILQPNPVQDFIKIRLDDKIESLELYDIQGKLVLNDKNPRFVTDVSFLKSGLYFMKVKTNDMTYLNKMVKE